MRSLYIRGHLYSEKRKLLNDFCNETSYVCINFDFFQGPKSHDKSKIHFNTFGGLIFRCIFLNVDGPVTKN